MNTDLVEMVYFFVEGQLFIAPYGYSLNSDNLEVFLLGPLELNLKGNKVIIVSLTRSIPIKAEELSERYVDDFVYLDLSRVLGESLSHLLKEIDTLLKGILYDLLGEKFFMLFILV